MYSYEEARAGKNKAFEAWCRWYKFSAIVGLISFLMFFLYVYVEGDASWDMFFTTLVSGWAVFAVLTWVPDKLDLFGLKRWDEAIAEAQSRSEAPFS